MADERSEHRLGRSSGPLFPNTETFEKLCERKTALFFESPAYIYEILQDELRHGTIRSNSQ